MPAHDKKPFVREEAVIETRKLGPKGKLHIRDLFLSYLRSLTKRVNEICDALDRLNKSVKRQERTRGESVSLTNDKLMKKIQPALAMRSDMSSH